MKAITVELQILDQLWRIENMHTENDVKEFIAEINEEYDNLKI